MTIKTTTQDTGVFREERRSFSLDELLRGPGSPGHEWLAAALGGPDLEGTLWSILAGACAVLQRFGCLPERVNAALSEHKGSVARAVEALSPSRLTEAQIDAMLETGQAIRCGFPDISLPEPGDPRLRRPRAKDAERNLAMLKGAVDLILSVANVWDQLNQPDSVPLSRAGLVLLGVDLGWEHCKLYVRACHGERRAQELRAREELRAEVPDPLQRSRRAYERGARDRQQQTSAVHEDWCRRAREVISETEAAGKPRPSLSALARVVSAEWAARWGTLDRCAVRTVRNALRDLAGQP